jgi:DNA polymerase III epsilon subunit-like protein
MTTEPDQVLEFTTKPKSEKEDTGDDIPPFPFRVDGVEMVASKPKDALIAQLAPIQSRRTSAVMKVKLALDFLDDCLAEPGKSLLRDRLLDPADDLDADDCIEMLHAIGDYWTEQQKKTNAAAAKPARKRTPRR